MELFFQNKNSEIPPLKVSYYFFLQVFSLFYFMVNKYLYINVYKYYLTRKNKISIKISTLTCKFSNPAVINHVKVWLGYTHDHRADKYPYPQDRRADKDSYPHDRNVIDNLCSLIKLFFAFIMVNFST